jgi:hypothetical protein
MRFLLRLRKWIFDFLCSMGQHQWQPVQCALKLQIDNSNHRLLECGNCYKRKYVQYPNKMIE